MHVARLDVLLVVREDALHGSLRLLLLLCKPVFLLAPLPKYLPAEIPLEARLDHDGSADSHTRLLNFPEAEHATHVLLNHDGAIVLHDGQPHLSGFLLAHVALHNFLEEADALRHLDAVVPP